MGKEIGHIELTSKNLTTTKRFYSSLFGWKFDTIGEGYAVFRTSKKGVGGGFQLGKEVKPGSTVFYVNVPTIPATQRKAKSLGGRILKKQKAIGGGMGYWGTIADPHGNVIGLWTPGKHAAPYGPGVPPARKEPIPTSPRPPTRGQ